jgi:hypothetical protein
LTIERKGQPDDIFSKDDTTKFKVDDVSMGQIHVAIVGRDAELADDDKLSNSSVLNYEKVIFK